MISAFVPFTQTLYDTYEMHALTYQIHVMEATSFQKFEQEVPYPTSYRSLLWDALHPV